VHVYFAVVLAVLFVVLYNVQTGHQDRAVGGSQVECVNAELVSPSSNLGQRYTMLYRYGSRFVLLSNVTSFYVASFRL